MKINYQTFTGLYLRTDLNETEVALFAKVKEKYDSKPDWTRFAAWWNVEFNASGLDWQTSVLWRICQDFETRLGVEQAKVAKPDGSEPTPKCSSCGNPATCYGTYEGITGYGCDVCCGHGCEDGECK